MAFDGKGRLLIRKSLKEVDWVETKPLSSQQYQCFPASWTFMPPAQMYLLSIPALLCFYWD